MYEKIDSWDDYRFDVSVRERIQEFGAFGPFLNIPFGSPCGYFTNPMGLRQPTPSTMPAEKTSSGTFNIPNIEKKSSVFSNLRSWLSQGRTKVSSHRRTLIDNLLSRVRTRHLRRHDGDTTPKKRTATPYPWLESTEEQDHESLEEGESLPPLIGGAASPGGGEGRGGTETPSILDADLDEEGKPKNGEDTSPRPGGSNNPDLSIYPPLPDRVEWPLPTRERRVHFEAYEPPPRMVYHPSFLSGPAIWPYNDPDERREAIENGKKTRQVVERMNRVEFDPKWQRLWRPPSWYDEPKR